MIWSSKHFREFLVSIGALFGTIGIWNVSLPITFAKTIDRQNLPPDVQNIISVTAMLYRDKGQIGRAHV